MKLLSNFELTFYLSCDQIDIEVVISIKFGWNTIAWGKIIHLGHYTYQQQNPYQQISKFCRFYRGTKIHIGTFLEHYYKHETDYILEVWERDCHLKKDTDICVII